MRNYATELQLFVGFPKKYALPSQGGALPQLPAGTGLDVQVPIWMESVECLFKEQIVGGRTLPKVLGEITGSYVYDVVGEVRFGGWEGDACIVLIISLSRTHTNLGNLLTKTTTPVVQRIADWLRGRVEADWVVGFQPQKSIRVKSESQT